LDHAPEYPALSRTVIEPPLFTCPWEGSADPVGLAVPDEDELLHAAAVATSAAAPAMQAVRTDRSRYPTAFTYS